MVLRQKSLSSLVFLQKAESDRFLSKNLQRWHGKMSSPEVAKENKHQIRETEHLLKAILEQKNGLARRIFSKDSVDNTRLLEATDEFIQRQPKVMCCFFYYGKFRVY
ncbi:chaperone protein ClpB3, chloroplastic [Tanacetum coccineum]|uniref:Chaperone protein ClpB3, chloroplastic n=1 Tax=Tanacetum coccineum TaxID=301880 RepID=A0ABQ5GE76_9ASTR